MRPLTAILLTILCMAATCQEPDTLTYYTPEYVDSLEMNYQAKLDILTDSITSLQPLIITDSVSIWKKDINIVIQSDGISVELDKKGREVNMKTSPNNTIRK